MKHFQSNLLIVLALALCGLCAFQWYEQTVQRDEITTCLLYTSKARVDVVNLTDNIYELRDGSGVGVNAAQYGERLGIFGSLSYVF